MKIGVFEGCEYQPLFELIQGKNIPQFKWCAVTPENWKKLECDVYFLSQEQSALILNEVTRRSSEVSSTGACDVMVRENGSLWPHNILGSIIQAVLIETNPHLDNQNTAYVVGDGAWARTMITNLITMGFAKINWVVSDRPRAEVAVQQICSSFFGVKIQLFESSDLTYQPNNGSVLINTLPLELYSEVSLDLSYLNFIQKSGLVVDLTLLPYEKDLLVEAKNVGIQTLHGAELALKWWDFFCNKWATQVSASVDPKEFESFLKSRPQSSKI
jgi:hypothetical protein